MSIGTRISLPSGPARPSPPRSRVGWPPPTRRQPEPDSRRRQGDPRGQERADRLDRGHPPGHRCPQRVRRHEQLPPVWPTLVRTPCRRSRHRTRRPQWGNVVGRDLAGGDVAGQRLELTPTKRTLQHATPDGTCRGPPRAGPPPERMPLPDAVTQGGTSRPLVQRLGERSFAVPLDQPSASPSRPVFSLVDEVDVVSGEW